MTRKYFKLGIQQLKDICNKNRNDIAILKEVHHELTHRKTRSAVELRGNLIGKSWSQKDGKFKVY